MKKNIIIGILSLITVTLVLFAYIKASDAEREFQRTEALQQVAEEAAEEAELKEQKALDVAAEALRITKELDKTVAELARCNSK